MGVVFRQSIKTSLVTVSGAVLGALTMWLSTRYIIKQQYGFSQTFTRQALTLSQMLIFGLNSTLYVYTHRYLNDTAKRKTLITLSLGIPFLLTAIVSVLYFCCKETVIAHFQPVDRDMVRQYFGWLPVYTLLFVYMALLEQYLGSQLKVAVSAFMREVLLRAVNIVLIILFAFGYISFHSLLTGSILIYFIPVLIFLAICYKTESFGFSLDLSVFTRQEYKEMTHFTWYHFLLSISIILMAYLDMLALYIYDHKGVAVTAVYSVAIFIISFLQIPSKAFLTSTFSILTAAFTDKNMEKAKDIFFRSSLNMLIATVGVAILICCNLNNAVAVIGNDKNYSELTGIFLILFIGRFVDIATGMNDQVLSITNYYKFNFYASITVTVILFFLLRFLIPVYSIYGAAWATTIALILFNVSKYVFIWKKLGVQSLSPKSFLVILAGLPALVAGLFFPYLFNEARHIYVHTFIDVALRSTIIVIVYVLMLIWLKPSQDLEIYLASIKKNKRLF